MSKKLEGKVAVVTGGNSGIGLATTKAFVREGAYVFIIGRREAELANAVKEIGSNVKGIPGDISNSKDASAQESSIDPRRLHRSELQFPKRAFHGFA